MELHVPIWRHKGRLFVVQNNVCYPPVRSIYKCLEQMVIYNIFVPWILGRIYLYAHKSRFHVGNKMIKLRCYVICSNRPPEGSQRAAGLTAVLCLSHDVKTTKFNQYLPVILTSNSRFQKIVMI